MSYVDTLQALPGKSRCWVFGTEAPLTEEKQQALLAELRAFMASWNSHGRAVHGDAAIMGDRFLAVGGALKADGALSGCSIDSMVHAIEDAARELHVGLLSPMMVFYRDPAGRIQSVTRGAFRRLVSDGAVGADTRVFDLTVSSVDALQGGQFELPLKESWHARAFMRRSTAVASAQ